MCHICRPHPWHREHNRQGVGTPVHWLRRSLTAYNSGSVTPSDAGGRWRIIMVFPAAIPVCRTAHWGLLGKKSTCYAGYLIVKVQALAASKTVNASQITEDGFQIWLIFFLYVGQHVEKCRCFFRSKIPWLRMNRWINVYFTMTAGRASYLVCKRQDFHIVANRSATGAKTHNQIIDFHFFCSGKEYLYNLAASFWRIYRWLTSYWRGSDFRLSRYGAKTLPLIFIFL